MKISRMTKLDNNANTKTAAFFDIQTNDEIILKGFRIVNGANGLFVSAPNEKGKDGRYYETVILPKSLRSEVEELALKEYENTGQE